MRSQKAYINHHYTNKICVSENLFVYLGRCSEGPLFLPLQCIMDCKATYYLLKLNESLDRVIPNPDGISVVRVVL